MAAAHPNIAEIKGLHDRRSGTAPAAMIAVMRSAKDGAIIWFLNSAREHGLGGRDSLLGAEVVLASPKLAWGGDGAGPGGERRRRRRLGLIAFRWSPPPGEPLARCR